jgi:hypothetical protein
VPEALPETRQKERPTRNGTIRHESPRSLPTPSKSAKRAHDISAIMDGVADILIRDLPDHVVAAIDANARRLGLSRNEYLRRRLAGTEDKAVPVSVTADDLARSAATFSDLLDPDVMTQAWS